MRSLRTKRTRQKGVCVTLVAWVALIAPCPIATAETAEIEADRTMDVLQSVGKLLVPNVRYENGYARHFDERCSATLVSGEAEAMESRLILSAWHCIEYYRDLSKTLIYEQPGHPPVSARILVAGGSMRDDWVLLRLAKALPNPIPLPISTSTLSEPRSATQNGQLIMVGYPIDGEAERARVVVSNCVHTPSSGRDRGSSCVIERGASGGAVFAGNTPLGEQPEYLGVISRGDRKSLSIYVPINRFRKRLAGYL